VSDRGEENSVPMPKFCFCRQSKKKIKWRNLFQCHSTMIPNM
jgi:hypothetical protein